MTTDGLGPLRLGACVRSTPRSVWALAALFGTLMALYTVFVPLYHGPDETKHVDMLFAVHEPGGWPVERDRRMNAQVVESVNASGYAPGRPARTVREVKPRRWRPTLAELARDAPAEAGNQMWQHPPLGYVVTGTALAAVTAAAPPTAEWAHDQVVGLARFLDALLLVPLPLLAFWTTRRLAGSGPAGAAAAVVAIAVPGVAHVGATVTNDGLLILLIGLLTVPLAYIATGDLSRRTAVVAGVVSGLALLTKGFALFLPAWVGAAFVLAVWRGGRPALPRAAVAGALTTGTAAVVGGWWWLRNLLEFGVIQPQGTTFGAAPEGFTPSFGYWFDSVASLAPRTFWGHFGWIEAQLPWAVIWTASGVFTLGIALAFATRRRTDRWRRTDVAILLGAFVGTAGIMLYGSWGFYLESGKRVAVHGRYLMPGLVGMAAAAGLGLTTPLRRWAGWLPPVLLAAAAALHLTSFAVLLDRYWMADGDGYAEGLDALLAWSPWPPTVVGVAAGLAAAALLWALVELIVAAVPRRRRRHAAPIITPQSSEAAPVITTPADSPAGT